MANHWYLVAHRAGARIFSQSGARRDLDLVMRMDHPEGRLKGQDLTTDRPGMADPSGNAYQPPSDPTDHVLKVFTKELAQHLDRSRQQGKFDTVVLVAPPRVLGELRGQLSSPTSKLVRETLSADLAAVEERAMPERLRGIMLEREPISAV